jgi:hypothetical protein
MTGGRTQGETMGQEQEPTEAGDQDPANRAPEPDGPMVQPVDAAEIGQETSANPERIVEDETTPDRG